MNRMQGAYDVDYPMKIDEAMLADSMKVSSGVSVVGYTPTHSDYFQRADRRLREDADNADCWRSEPLDGHYIGGKNHLHRDLKKLIRCGDEMEMRGDFCEMEW